MRGMAFEEIIQNACNAYRRLGVALIDKTPEPIKQLGRMDKKGQFKACYQKQAQVDFKGVMKPGVPIAFEAKITSLERINQAVVKEWQMDYLMDFDQCGGVAFILFGLGGKYYRMPAFTWNNMKEIFGRKYIDKKDRKTLEEYEVEFAYHCGGNDRKSNTVCTYLDFLEGVVSYE